MDFEEVVKRRRSVRLYQDRKVSEDKIKKILEFSNLSPSAGNLQARSVIVIQDKKNIKDITETTGQDWLNTAPVLIIVFAKPKSSAFRYAERGRKIYALQDATIFAAYLQLAAVSYGLSSCWVGAFDKDKLKRALKIKENLLPIAIISIGYPAEKPGPKSRQSLDELIIKT